TGNDSPGDEYDLEDDIVKPQGEMHNDPQRQTERDRMGEPGQGGFSAEDGSDSEMGTWQESTPTTVAPTVAPTPTQEDRPSGTDWDQDSHTGSSTESDNMSPESGHDATTDQSSDWTRDETDHNWGN
ncbi:MAG: hypothetical protein GWP18_03780, partial [Proteobacteria bacterium]|nr:hypothetical protein [Pseudomonadota bacterium]